MPAIPFRYLRVTNTDGNVIVVFNPKKLTDGRVIQSLEREFGNVVRMNPGKRIVLDYTGVRTQSGKMYAALAFLHKKAKEADSDVWMVHMCDEFKRALQDQKMHRLFTIKQSLDDVPCRPKALSA